MYSNRASILVANTLQYIQQHRRTFANESASLQGCLAASQSGHLPTSHMLMVCIYFIFFRVLACFAPLRAANNCRWLYTMADINRIIPYSACIFLSYILVFLIVSDYTLFTTTAYKFISNSQLFR